jgi:hypothetical protein
MTKPHSATLCTFTGHCSGVSKLSRLLDVLARVGAQPAWELTWVQRDRFRLETNIGDLTTLRATKTAEYITEEVNVLKIDWKFFGEKHGSGGVQ